MKRLFSLCAALALVAVAVNCRTPEFRQGFYVAGSGDVDAKLLALRATLETWKDFLPVQEPVTIELRSRRDLPPALYDSASGTIALDPSMPVESFRHEAAHRLLDLNAKSKDYWFQEGIALFLEANESASCGSILRLPPRIVATLDESIPEQMPFESTLDLSNDEDSRELRASAAAYFQFLWREKDFRNFLSATNPEPFFSRHRKGFEQFLKFGEYRRPWPGC